MTEETEGEDVDMGEPDAKETVNEYLTHSHIENSAPSNTGTHSFHRTLVNEDNSFDHDKFCENLEIKINKCNDEDMEFDMIGVEAPIANAFRRIMISEVPTMAFDKVVVNNNTSVLPDEVIAHRIGLVPIKVDPRKFRTKDKMKLETKQNLLDFEKEKPPDGDYVPQMNLVCNEDMLFKLQVECRRSSQRSKILVNDKVYTKHLEWVPIGDQKERFPEGVRPVFEDILLCVLSPGQVIDMELYVEKGIGKTHAKWSPVSTASYKLLPVIKIVGDIRGKDAEIMKKKCPRRVFDIEDGELIVKKKRNCSFCKECIRDEETPKIKLGKKKNHFIFSVESTGIYTPIEIFRESVGIFYNKCREKLRKFNQVVDRINVGESVLY